MTLTNWEYDKEMSSSALADPTALTNYFSS
jgi:hypothetical protein